MDEFNKTSITPEKDEKKIQTNVYETKYNRKPKINIHPKIGQFRYAILLLVFMSISYFIVFVHRLTIPSLDKWIKIQYSKEDRELTDLDIAYSSSVYFWCYGVIQIIIGIVSVYSRILIPLSLILMSAGSLMIGYSTNLNVLYVGSAIVGLGAGTCYLSITTNLSMWWPGWIFPCVNGLCSFFGYVGGFVSSSLVLNAMSDIFGLGNTFVFFAVISVIVALLYAFFGRDCPADLGYGDPNVLKEKKNSCCCCSLCSKKSKDDEEELEEGSKKEKEKRKKGKKDKKINKKNFKKEKEKNDEDDGQSMSLFAVMKTMRELRKAEKTLKKSVTKNNPNLALPKEAKKSKEAHMNVFKYQFKSVFSKYEYSTHVLLVGLSQALIMGSYFCNSGIFSNFIVEKIFPTYTNFEKSIGNSSLTMSPLFGCLAMPFVSNFLGRVTTGAICAIGMVASYIGHVFMYLNNNVTFGGFIACNIFVGFFYGMSVSSGYTHQKEKFSTDIAGAAMGVHSTLQYFISGLYTNIISPLVLKNDDYQTGIKNTYLMFLISCAIAFVLICFADETKKKTPCYKLQAKRRERYLKRDEAILAKKEAKEKKSVEENKNSKIDNNINNHEEKKVEKDEIALNEENLITPAITAAEVITIDTEINPSEK